LRIIRVDYHTTEGKSLAHIYSVRSHPTVILINTRGDVEYMVQGIPDTQELLDNIESMQNKR